MFWKKGVVLDEPTGVPTVVAKRIVELMQKLPHDSDHWVTFKAVMRPHEGKPDAFDFRVYDQYETDKKRVKVVNWASLDGHADLIQYEGWFDNKTKKVEVATKQAA